MSDTTATGRRLPDRLDNPLKSAVMSWESLLVLVALAIFLANSFASPYFLTWENMRAMAMAFAVEGIVVVGMTILLISGGIDLSVGSVTALAMVIAGLLFLNGVDPWTASLIAILACTAIGAIMGFFVTKVGLHHFIVSLAAMVIARGACLLGTGGRPLGLFTLPPEFKFIGQGSIGVIPVVIIIFIVVVVAFDFKTGKVPQSHGAIPASDKAQMSAYTAALRVIFAGREVRAALLYTSGPQLFEL